MIHGKSCYHALNDSMAVTHDDARSICQNLGADLAVINSSDENDFIYDLVKNSRSLWRTWIGLRKKADGKFYWLDDLDTPLEGNYEGNYEGNQITMGATRAAPVW